MSPDELHKYLRTSGKSPFEVALYFANRNEWQPIETAPKDGRYIIISVNSNYQVICNWVSEEKGWMTRTAQFYGMDRVTHWKPIEPPKDSNHGN